MSSYTYTSTNGRRSLVVEPAVTEPDSVFVSAGHKSYPMSGIWISNADVPTVALELLKAAGHIDLAELIESAAREAAEKAEAEAAEKKLQERRDALARKYLGLPFRMLGGGTQEAINRIIELEDGASRD